MSFLLTLTLILMGFNGTYLYRNGLFSFQDNGKAKVNCYQSCLNLYDDNPNNCPAIWRELCGIACGLRHL